MDLGSGGKVPARLHAGGVEGKVEHLFEMIRNPKTVEPYTNAEVVRMSTGVLAEADVEGIMAGRIADPLMGQIAALAAAFGLPTSYLLLGQGLLSPRRAGA